MVVPQTTMGSPDGEHAIAEVLGIQDRGIRAAVRHYSSLTNCLSSVVAGCLMALARKQRFHRREDTQGDVKPRLVLRGGKGSNAFVRHYHRVVSISLDKLRGGALDVGFCNHLGRLRRGAADMRQLGRLAFSRALL